MLDQRITFKEFVALAKRSSKRKCRFILRDILTEVWLEMGAKPSSISDLQHNTVLQKFTGDTAIGKEEEFWEDILAFSFQAPYNR